MILRKVTLSTELKNTAKTRGHRVSILTPQTLILPKFAPHTAHFLAEKSTFQDLNRFQGTLSISEWHWLIGHNMDASKRVFGTTGILVFDFELFIGVPFETPRYVKKDEHLRQNSFG